MGFVNGLDFKRPLLPLNSNSQLGTTPVRVRLVQSNSGNKAMLSPAVTRAWLSLVKIKQFTRVVNKRFEQEDFNTSCKQKLNSNFEDKTWSSVSNSA